MNVSLLDGQLAWRQHDGGHTDAPNWKYFIPWADKFLQRAPVRLRLQPPADAGGAPLLACSAASAQTFPPTSRSRVPTRTRSSPTSSFSLREPKAASTSISKATPSPAAGAPPTTRSCSKTGSQNFFGWNAADFGWGADRIENILWRLENGELDGVNPKVIVLLAGTNNVGNRIPPEGSAAVVDNVTKGIAALLRVVQDKAPGAVIVLTAIFPRNDNMAVMSEIDRINADLAKMTAGGHIRFLNINDRLADSTGKLHDGMMNPDKLHPALPGYQVWADALKPVFREILGPPAAADHAPPPTGDPSATARP